MTTLDKVRFVFIRTIGNFLVLFALFGVFATFGPALYYEAQYRVIQIRGIKFIVQTIEGFSNKQDTNFGDIISGPTQQILAPVDPKFNVLIPKIGANAKVFPNVDPSKPDLFLPILKNGVAHAQGTFFPGQKGNIYLFAHSTDNFWDVGRYNAIFYLLKDLEKEDEVVVFFKNIRHNYIVTDKKVVGPKEVSYLTEAQTNKELLILQTCWPPGTTWQRLMVFAEPK